MHDRRVDEAALAVRPRIGEVPAVGVVLGSGLGGFATTLGGLVRIPYSEVPHFRTTSVAGHAGSLCVGDVGGTRVACLAGRVHLYEGHPVEDVVFGCRLLASLGCRVVLLTNAAGGIGEGLRPGSLMLIVDHLNLTGKNPLLGGPHFVDLTRAYDVDVVGAARDAAKDEGVALAEGVYAGLLGPSYETPAEIRMLRTLGAHAVGMSTVMETIALRALGVRVGAMSCITNFAAGLSDAVLDHDDVQATALAAERTFKAVLTRWIERCGALSAEPTKK
ncbi:MAG TPA: purine-nucleoside phosphorylase [Polyangiaceae bacterium]|jgi:purine-nucleoside phosphorylase|nr:purine-nucleoside phosphorylase [Polyangiaceae bacterium]